MVRVSFQSKKLMESAISKTLRFIHPYLSFVTYRFHVEKAREAGNIFDNNKIIFCDYNSTFFFLTSFNLILYRYKNWGFLYE